MKRSTPLLIFYLFTLLVASSRGVFQIAVGKTFGYIIQLISLILLAVFWLLYFRKLIFRQVTIFNYYWIALCLASLSFIFTLLIGTNSFYQALLVFAVNLLNLFFLAIACVIGSNRNHILVKSLIGEEFVYKLVSIVTVYVCFLALLQYFGIVQFPGFWYVENQLRLSGSLGSKQHLSLLVAVLTSLSLTTLIDKSKFFDLLISSISIFILIISFTRIGYFVFVVNVVVFLLFKIFDTRRNSFKSLRFWMFLFLISLTFFAFRVALPEVSDALFIRLFSILDLNDYANEGRFIAMSNALSFLVDTPILISDQLGSASQIPSQVLSMFDFNHYETGINQYLINFGVLFVAVVTIMFLRWWIYFLLDKPGRKFSSFLPVSLYLSLFIYMYNEIVPIFVFFPLISMLNVKPPRVRSSVNSIV